MDLIQALLEQNAWDDGHPGDARLSASVRQAVAARAAEAGPDSDPEARPSVAGPQGVWTRSPREVLPETARADSVGNSIDQAEHMREDGELELQDEMW